MQTEFCNPQRYGNEQTVLSFILCGCLTYFAIYGNNRLFQIRTILNIHYIFLNEATYGSLLSISLAQSKQKWGFGNNDKAMSHVVHILGLIILSKNVELS